MEAVLKEQEINLISNTEINNENIFDLLLKEEDLTWQTVLYELVKEHKMDPWDIDISLLTKRFIDMVKHIKEVDFRVSGKIVLAAAILLKIKSNKMLLDDITSFDSLFTSNDSEEFMDCFDSEDSEYENYEAVADKRPEIFPRTPQPRTRKVSIFDLVDALEKALNVKNRRKIVQKLEAPKIHLKKDYRDISLVIGDTYELLKELAKEHNTTSFDFHELLPSDSKEDKIYTFIPMLHLTNLRKIDMEQENHFGNINIELLQQN